MSFCRSTRRDPILRVTPSDPPRAGTPRYWELRVRQCRPRGSGRDIALPRSGPQRDPWQRYQGAWSGAGVVGCCGVVWYGMVWYDITRYVCV